MAKILGKVLYKFPSGLLNGIVRDDNGPGFLAVGKYSVVQTHAEVCMAWQLLRLWAMFPIHKYIFLDLNEP